MWSVKALPKWRLLRTAARSSSARGEGLAVRGNRPASASACGTGTSAARAKEVDAKSVEVASVSGIGPPYRRGHNSDTTFPYAGRRAGSEIGSGHEFRSSPLGQYSPNGCTSPVRPGGGGRHSPPDRGERMRTGGFGSALRVGVGARLPFYGFAVLDGSVPDGDAHRAADRPGHGRGRAHGQLPGPSRLHRLHRAPDLHEHPAREHHL